MRSRPGYFFTKVGGDDESIRQAQELMAMQSDLAFTSVPIHGQWQKIDPAGDQRKVHFILSVPAGVPMIDADHNNHLSLDFRAFVIDGNGQAVAKIGQRFETNLNPDGVAEIQGQGLDYANVLTLPPGQYKVHFVVRDNMRGTMGSVVAPLKIE